MAFSFLVHSACSTIGSALAEGRKTREELAARVAADDPECVTLERARKVVGRIMAALWAAGKVRRCGKAWELVS